MNYTTELDYISGKTILDKDVFGISPSSISKFIEKPHLWYQEMILGNKEFNQSTSTILGTLTHYCAEQYIKYKQINYIEIYKYIIKNVCLEPEEGFKALESLTSETFEEDSVIDWIENSALNPEFDTAAILAEWRPMGQALISHLIEKGVPQEAEPLVKAEVKPGYWAAGSIDAIRNGSMIIDYKTTSDKTPKAYIPMMYKYQLLTYAWICKQNGIHIDRISIIWVTRNDVNRISEKTGKLMKDYPSQAVTVTEVVTEEDFAFIESILSMIADTVEAGKKYPELLHCLFKDPRLKEN